MKPGYRTPVYKYRGLDALENRDLPMIAADQFFAPSVGQLNDPAEAFLDRDELVEALARADEGLARSMAEYEALRFVNGVYSLSRTVTDEVMWSHYAQSHQGFCIEYDLSRLVLEARAYWETIDVRYAARPPRITIADFGQGSRVGSAAQKPLGHKSLRWSNERELRIVVPQAGLNSYARAALSAVYFGVRFPEEKIPIVRAALAGRGIRYYRMQHRPQSYELYPTQCEPIDIDGNVVETIAPIESEDVLRRDLFSGDDRQYAAWRRAVELVRRDPSCLRIVGGDLSMSTDKKGLVYVHPLCQDSCRITVRVTSGGAGS
jgi:hypothetical protein